MIHGLDPVKQFFQMKILKLQAQFPLHKIDIKKYEHKFININ